MSELLNSFAASQAAEDDHTRSTQSSLSIPLRPSLWSHMRSLLQPAEVDEAQQLIASPLIAENAAIEEEIRALLHVAASLSSHSFPLSSVTSLSSASYAAVPPLPSLLTLSQREQLKDEVVYLISALREKAGGRGGADVTQLVRGLSPREAAIASLVEREKILSSRSQSPSTSSRPSTTRGRDSRPSTSASQSFSSASRGSLSSRPTSSSASTSLGASLGLSSMSIFTLEKVVARIRRALLEEHEELLRDVDFLRHYIEEEEAELLQQDRDIAEAQAIPPPTVTELRALNERLVAAVRHEEQRERTARLLQSTPPRAAFQAGVSVEGKGRASADVVEQRVNEESAAPDSVDSMMAELDELEASLYRATPVSTGLRSSTKEEPAGGGSRPSDVLSLVDGNEAARPEAADSPASALSQLILLKASACRPRAGASLAPLKPSPHLPSLRTS